MDLNGTVVAEMGCDVNTYGIIICKGKDTVLFYMISMKRIKKRYFI